MASTLFALAVYAQQQQPVTGVETNWDARRLVSAALKADQDLRPILASLNPRDWYENKGAPSTYTLQWQSAQDQVKYVETAGNSVLQKVDSLPPLIELYYRMESLELTARSLNQGAQQYAPRPDAEKLDRWVGQAFDARRRMREYIEDLATSLEQNYKIADEEAQRCRGSITRVPASKRPGNK
jgi:hypothetical protein